jgi:hypothetical protein
VTDVAPQTQSRIFCEKQTQTLYNQSDSGSDLQRRKRCFIHSKTSVISNYLNDSTTSFDDKGTLWLDIAESAGVKLSETAYFKSSNNCIINFKTV